jgi:hypothetical protein
MGADQSQSQRDSLWQSIVTQRKRPGGLSEAAFKFDLYQGGLTSGDIWTRPQKTAKNWSGTLVADPRTCNAKAGGGVVWERDRETGVRVGPEAGEDEAPAWKVDDLQSSTTASSYCQPASEVTSLEGECQMESGIWPSEDDAPAWKVDDLQWGATASSYCQPAWTVNDLQSASSYCQRVDQTMKESPEAEGGTDPMEGVKGVEDLFRCDRGSRLAPTQQLAPGGFRMLTARPNQVDGHHLSCAGTGARRSHGRGRTLAGGRDRGAACVWQRQPLSPEPQTLNTKS